MVFTGERTFQAEGATDAEALGWKGLRVRGHEHKVSVAGACKRGEESRDKNTEVGRGEGQLGSHLGYKKPLAWGPLGGSVAKH